VLLDRHSSDAVGAGGVRGKPGWVGGWAGGWVRPAVFTSTQAAVAAVIYWRTAEAASPACKPCTYPLTCRAPPLPQPSPGPPLILLPAPCLFAASGREYVMPVRNIGRHGYKSDIKALCE
jgi:hypothetical protein